MNFHGLKLVISVSPQNMRFLAEAEGQRAEDGRQMTEGVLRLRSGQVN